MMIIKRSKIKKSSLSIQTKPQKQRSSPSEKGSSISPNKFGTSTSNLRDVLDFVQRRINVENDSPFEINDSNVCAIRMYAKQQAKQNKNRICKGFISRLSGHSNQGQGNSLEKGEKMPIKGQKIGRAPSLAYRTLQRKSISQSLTKIRQSRSRTLLPSISKLSLYVSGKEKDGSEQQFSKGPAETYRQIHTYRQIQTQRQNCYEQVSFKQSNLLGYMNQCKVRRIKATQRSKQSSHSMNIKKQNIRTSDGWIQGWQNHYPDTKDTEMEEHVNKDRTNCSEL